MELVYNLTTKDFERPLFYNWQGDKNGTLVPLSSNPDYLQKLSDSSRKLEVVDWPFSGSGGSDWSRTSDPLRAKQVLSQLSYGPSLRQNTVKIFFCQFRKKVV